MFTYFQSGSDCIDKIGIYSFMICFSNQYIIFIIYYSCVFICKLILLQNIIDTLFSFTILIVLWNN